MAKTPTSRQDKLAVLDELSTQLHDEFPDARARLEQFDAHLATVRMVVDHIYDEAETG